jgi:class 3 adenylate cyclase
MGNIAIGAFICVGTGLFDVIDSLLLHHGITATQYGFLIFTVGTTLILAKRFGFLYNQQQRIILRSNKGMNARLVDWIVVQDRDPADLPSVHENRAIMFTDIRNFTHLSEKMDPPVLMDFLGSLNEVLAKPIFEYEDQGFAAYTDKFIGDGTMNIITDPGIALKAAVGLRSQLRLFNANPQFYFPQAPKGFHVEVGTGIAYGPVNLGIMGHSRRVDYTPIGDTVNLASRLESLTKEYRIPIILDDGFYKSLASADRPYLRYIDRIRVLGKDQPVNIYEEYSCNEAAARDLKLKQLPRFHELREMYFSGKNWDTAIALAGELLKEWENSPAGQDDPLPLIYKQRMEMIAKNPGRLAQWDGVYSFTRK